MTHDLRRWMNLCEAKVESGQSKSTPISTLEDWGKRGLKDLRDVTDAISHIAMVGYLTPNGRAIDMGQWEHHDIARNIGSTVSALLDDGVARMRTDASSVNAEFAKRPTSAQIAVMKEAVRHRDLSHSGLRIDKRADIGQPANSQYFVSPPGARVTPGMIEQAVQKLFPAAKPEIAVGESRRQPGRARRFLLP